MHSPRTIRTNSTRLVASVLAVLGAASGIPLALAQLDFAGIVDALGIDRGDTAEAVVVLVGVAGVLTLCVIVAALVGAALCVTGSTAARPVLVGAAIAGFATALLLWMPAAVAIGAAAVLTDPGTRGRDSALPAL